MRFWKVGLAAILVLAILGAYVSLRPIRYEHRGLKYVEQRNGLTCSYFPHDNWEQWPLTCMSTDRARNMHGRE